MNYIPVSIIAYLLNAFSVLTNKFLLTKSIPHPISYVFYISASSLIVLVALPFTHIPSSQVFALLSLSTLFWTVGIYYLFSALKIGLASRVAPVIGILNPIFLILYYFLFTNSISLNEVWGALFCILGLLLIVLHYLRDHLKKLAAQNRRREFLFELLAGVFFAISYILLREAYNHTDFLTGLVWSRLILLPITIGILAIHKLRKLVFSSQGDKINFLSKTGFLFIFGQVTGGVSQFMVTFAISLANPALVNSLQGVQYAFLFIASLFLTKKFPQIFNENLTRWAFVQKIVGIALVAFGLYMLSFAHSGPQKAILGLTYSPRYAQSLGLNPKTTYVSLLQQLSPGAIRLPIYWDQVFPKKTSKANFSLSDYYVEEASQYGTKLTLAVGYKVPRFPECFIPKWVPSAKTNPDEFNKDLFAEITAVVNHYKDSPSLSYWQVENEMLFPFGSCPSTDWNRLKKEVDLVHQLDPKHPVIITESGEFGLWLPSAKAGDIVGVSLYRRTLAPYANWFKSPLPPYFYQLKADLVDSFFPHKRVFVSELQTEPWADKPLPYTTYAYQSSALPLKDLSDNVSFAKEAGFDEIYLWGVEWWYYLSKHNHPDYLNQAITIFTNN